jgi:hypothetical protein
MFLYRRAKPQMVRSDRPHCLAASPSTSLSPHFLALYQTFIELHKHESFDAAANAVHLTCCRITGYGAISTIHMRASTSPVCQAGFLIRLPSCFRFASFSYLNYLQVRVGRAGNPVRFLECCSFSLDFLVICRVMTVR